MEIIAWIAGIIFFANTLFWTGYAFGWAAACCDAEARKRAMDEYIRGTDRPGRS